MATTTRHATPARALRGPKPHLLRGNIPEYGADPLGFMVRCAREYGDLVPIRFGPFRAYLARAPALVEEVLVTRQRDFRKSLGTRMLRSLVGEGLLTAEGDTWLGQRRLAQPAFHRDRVAGYGRVMVDYAEEHVAGWRDGRELDLHREMMALTFRIVARVLFDADVTDRIAQVARANAELQAHFERRFNSLALFVPEWVPTPGNVRYRRWLRRLDELVLAIIRERKVDARDHGDLLSMLLAVRHEGGRPMSERQLRDEVMTLMLAGHETTALLLTWAWMLLGQHPAVAERLGDEARSVLGGRSPTVGDVPALRYAEAVVNETLRLYPPAYATGREAIVDTSVGGFTLRKRQTVLMSPYVSGRDPRHFDSPDSFRPERWLDGLAKLLPRGAFYPFGLGPRKCIGADFAMLEATLLLATIAQRWRFTLVEGQSFEPMAAVTLRPKHGVRATTARVR